MPKKSTYEEMERKIIELEKECLDLKKASKALKESEQRLELALNGADLGSWDWLLETGEVVYNERWAEIRGYDLNEIEPSIKSFERTVHPDDHPKVMKALKLHSEGHSPYYETAHRCKTKSGKWRWVLDRGKIVERDKCGKAVRAGGTNLDITKQKKMEEELRESEERYRSIVENFKGIAYRGSMNFSPIFFHGDVEEITGYQERELTSGRKRWNQLIHPEDLTSILTEDEEKLRLIPNYSYEREYRILRKDGEIRWIHEVIRNICDEANKPIMLQGVLYDITHRKQVEEALRESEERYRSLFENSRDAIVMTSPDGRYIDINQAALELFGYTRDEFSSVNAKETYANPRDRKKLLKAIELKGFAKDYEYRLKKRDGTKMICITTATLRRDKDGNGVEVQAIIRDITERKEAEKALLQKDKKLQNQAHHLEEVNTALKVLIERREEEKKELEESMVSNVTKLLYPYLEKLEGARLGAEEKTYVGIIKSNLEKILSPLANKLSSKYYALTPKEIEVANLINQGKTSKEIAALLKVSPKTIMFHRDSIRRKLGLSNKKMNLRSYLQSFPQ